MKLCRWLNNLFYRAPEGYEDAYKSAVKRVKEAQSTPETDPLIAICGKEIVDIIVHEGWPSMGTTTKIYMKDGTVLVIDSVIGEGYKGKPIIETTKKLNRYTIEKNEYNNLSYIEVTI
jgi:hypothetical protein